MNRWGLVILPMAMAACASHPTPVLPGPTLTADALLAGERLSLELPEPPAGLDWLQPDPAMLAFLEQLELRGGTAQRIQQVLAGVREQGAAPFSYQVDVTLPASGAFHAREGNCMAFSAMVVSLLRAAGMEAHFQRVQVVPEWDLWGDDVSVAGQHINTRVRLPNGRALVVDWGGASGLERSVRKLEDDEALAEFHNNLGVNAMIDGEHALAFAHLRRALELEPGLSHLWSNLAVLYQRHGDDLAAENAWLQALQQDAAQVMAMGGLKGLYRRTGRTELAEQLTAALARERGRDPFYHYMQARRAAHEGHWKDARKRLETALSLQRHERFEALLQEVRQREVAPRDGAG